MEELIVQTGALGLLAIVLVYVLKPFLKNITAELKESRLEVRRFRKVQEIQTRGLLRVIRHIGDNPDGNAIADDVERELDLLKEVESDGDRI